MRWRCGVSRRSCGRGAAGAGSLSAARQRSPASPCSRAPRGPRGRTNERCRTDLPLPRPRFQPRILARRRRRRLPGPGRADRPFAFRPPRSHVRGTRRADGSCRQPALRCRHRDRRPLRAERRQPLRVRRNPLRGHAPRGRPGAAQLQAVGGVARLHRAGCRLPGRLRGDRGYGALGGGRRTVRGREEVGRRRRRQEAWAGRRRLAGLRARARGIVGPVRSPGPRRRPPGVSTLHVGVDRQAQGRRPLPRGPALVGALPAEVLARRPRRPGSRRRPPLPQRTRWPGR